MHLIGRSPFIRGILREYDSGPCILHAVGQHHGPAAVWCHLRPILGVIRTEHPTVKKIHYFSDGPTSQYKQKGNFLLFANIPLKFGFSSGKIIMIIDIIKV